MQSDLHGHGMGNKYEEYKAEIQRKTEYLNELFENWKQHFPNLFEGYSRDSFDVPQGWESLVFSFLNRVEETGAKLKQIKQKFGGLRIYVDDYNKYYQEMGMRRFDVGMVASSFEVVSRTICEECGAFGALTRWDRKFVQTLCDTCVVIADENL